MAKVILRQEAINDLTDIWDYTLHEWSENEIGEAHHILLSDDKI